MQLKFKIENVVIKNDECFVRKPQNGMNNCALIVFNLLSRKLNLKLNSDARTRNRLAS